jgi:hypothetical protein
MLLCSNELFVVLGRERHSRSSSTRATLETAATKSVLQKNIEKETGVYRYWDVEGYVFGVSRYDSITRVGVWGVGSLNPTSLVGWTVESEATRCPLSPKRTFQSGSLMSAYGGATGSAQRSIGFGKLGICKCRTEPKCTLPLCSTARELFRVTP